MLFERIRNGAFARTVKSLEQESKQIAGAQNLHATEDLSSNSCAQGMRILLHCKAIHLWHEDCMLLVKQRTAIANTRVCAFETKRNRKIL